MDATLAAGVRIGNVPEWCRVSGVDRRTFCRHKARIEAEGSWQPRSRRPGTSPGATPGEVVAEIVRLRGELAPGNGADAIIAALGPVAAQRGWQVPHRSAVNKILRREGLVIPQPAKRPRSSFRRFAYARPRDCYQLDATEVKLATGEAVVVFDVLDDCTRLLAACHAAPAAAVAAITAAAAAHGAPGIVLCDNGTAMGGGRSRGQGTVARTVQATGSRIIRSSPYHPQACGKAKHHHQTLRNWLATRPAPATLPALQALLDDYRDYYSTRRHHTAVQDTPRAARDSASSHGGPGHLPARDDAAIHRLTVAASGTIKLDNLRISTGQHLAGQPVTAIRDHDRVTCYTTDGTPIGHLHLHHHKTCQGRLTPAA